MSSPLPPLRITKENWRKTGVTLGRGAVGKTDRIPSTGTNLELRRANYDRIAWDQPYCTTCLRDCADCLCPSPA